MNKELLNIINTTSNDEEVMKKVSKMAGAIEAVTEGFKDYRVEFVLNYKDKTPVIINVDSRNEELNVGELQEGQTIWDGFLIECLNSENAIIKVQCYFEEEGNINSNLFIFLTNDNDFVSMPVDVVTHIVRERDLTDSIFDGVEYILPGEVTIKEIERV